MEYLLFIQNNIVGVSLFLYLIITFIVFRNRKEDKQSFESAYFKLNTRNLVKVILVNSNKNYVELYTPVEQGDGSFRVVKHNLNISKIEYRGYRLEFLNFLDAIDVSLKLGLLDEEEASLRLENIKTGIIYEYYNKGKLPKELYAKFTNFFIWLLVVVFSSKSISIILGVILKNL